MFTTEITNLKSQLAELNAQIARYEKVQIEFGVVVEAIVSLQQKADALSPNSGEYLRTELVKRINLVAEEERQPPTAAAAPVAEEEESSVNDSLPIIEALVASTEASTSEWVSLVEPEIAEPDSSYDTAEKIAAALADTEDLDTHLMAIASILDECNAQEIPGRVCFFVQNIPSEFDDSILGYLPKSIRLEWDKQRTYQEQEARESILPPPSETLVLGVGDLVETTTGIIGHITDITFNAKDGGRIATVSLPNQRTGEFDIATLRYIGKYEASAPEFNVGDWVELHNGEIAQVTQTKDIGGKIYVEVNGKDAYRSTDLKPAQGPVEVKGEIPAPVAAATTKKPRKTKAKPGMASEILKCKSWAAIRAIANNDKALIKEAATSAKSKSEMELIEKLPKLIYDFMIDSGDYSDFDWMPAYITQAVRSIMSAPGA